jgi:hypothetical protein
MTSLPPRQAAPLLRQAQRRRLLTPFRAVMLVALIGSSLLIAFGMIDRTATQIPILAAGLAVLGITFGAIAIACVVTIVRAGRDGRTALAFWAALGGGAAVVATAGCLAAAVVLAMLWGSASGA